MKDMHNNNNNNYINIIFRGDLQSLFIFIFILIFSHIHDSILCYGYQPEKWMTPALL